MSKIIVLMIFLLFTYSVVNGFNDHESRSAEIHEANSAPGFQQLGYFADGGKSHIFAVKIPVTVTKDQVEQYARDQTSKTGQSAALYFFEDGSEIPADEISQAENLFDMNNILYNKDGLSKWRFAFMRKLNGTTRMVDCTKYPQSDLCRT
mgnify:FL=1